MNANQYAKYREWRAKVHQCKSKWRHDDLFLALQHAKEVSKKTKAPFTVYQCEKCGFMHVGRMGDNESILMYGPWSEDVRELQKADW